VAEGDRVMSREEVVELADAVAAWGGIAAGIGTTRYGAQLIVDAEDRDTAHHDPDSAAGAPLLPDHGRGRPDRHHRGGRRHLVPPPQALRGTR